MGIFVEQLPSSRYRAIVTRDGVRRTSATFAARADALFAGIDLIVSLGDGRYRPDGSLGELLVGHIVGNGHRWSAGTREDRMRVVRRLPEATLMCRASKITGALLANLWTTLAADGWSVHRIERVRVTMSSAFGSMRSTPAPAHRTSCLPARRSSAVQPNTVDPPGRDAHSARGAVQTALRESVLECACGAIFEVDSPSDLFAHTHRVHARRPSVVERTPKAELVVRLEPRVDRT